MLLLFLWYFNFFFAVQPAEWTGWLRKKIQRKQHVTVSFNALWELKRISFKLCHPFSLHFHTQVNHVLQMSISTVIMSNYRDFKCRGFVTSDFVFKLFSFFIVFKLFPVAIYLHLQTEIRLELKLRMAQQPSSPAIQVSCSWVPLYGNAFLQAFGVDLKPDA